MPISLDKRFGKQYRKADLPMWFENYCGNLVFGNDSLFAFRIDASRTMRSVSVSRPRAEKHIANRKAAYRKHAITAKDG